MGRSKHCTEEVRNLIINLKNYGKIYKQIQELVGCSLKMICNALKWKPKPEKRGNKRSTTAIEDRRIVSLAKKEPFITTSKIKERLELNINTSTIRRRLIHANLNTRAPRKVALLSKKHIENCLKFGRMNASWPKEKWRNVLWTDESKVKFFGSHVCKQYVRRPTGAAYNPQLTLKTVKHGG